MRLIRQMVVECGQPYQTTRALVVNAHLVIPGLVIHDIPVPEIIDPIPPPVVVIRIHGLPVPYNCRYPGCGQSFTSQELVQRHHRQSHRSPVRTTISNHSRSSSERSFSTNASTTRPTARSPELFKCTDCGKIVGTQEALRGHYLANHINSFTSRLNNLWQQ
ncbi:unnamed protein product [Oppiella nova]|uniref:C2H2-type domain-containing protein n=1 Tax=Oppiella nova TaxID=334625 RepID=A0A7R9MGZ9_9ACAR|nr:unnamed protein product [Oppiella nova]CAG2177230.1 unnamed protein product [Oppiella nova]